ncbi:MAG: hypothetical protein JNK23_04740 [Opitutaceae bacterium]|nr:hypothetical protein [Opitutaceae bacterium]
MKFPSHRLPQAGFPVPPVLRSWAHLEATMGVAPPAGLPITSGGQTFVMAQELAWLDSNHFAVGRWDGSLSIFQFNQAPSAGPVIAKAVNTPAAEGVQMITPLTSTAFVSSNDALSMIVWQTSKGDWTDLSVMQTLEYGSMMGVANSGATFLTADGAALFLIVGHAYGYVTIWQGAPNGCGLTLIETVNVRSTNPVNPWSLHNVRGIGVIGSGNGETGYVVTGSEDGDLCVIRIPDGTLLSRQVYNPAAQRGINSLCTSGLNLLVANCAVGAADFNLWSYTIDPASWTITKADAARLVVDSTKAQVFNFDVIWGEAAGARCWFSATEEGYLWMGTASDGGALALIGAQKVTAPLGAALGMQLPSHLALVAYDLYEFDTGAPTRS